MSELASLPIDTRDLLGPWNLLFYSGLIVLVDQGHLCGARHDGTYRNPSMIQCLFLSLGPLLERKLQEISRLFPFF